MKLPSSIVRSSRAAEMSYLSGVFLRITLFSCITSALLLAPTFANAQNPHKPTARPFKPRIDETRAQVEAGVQGPHEGGEAILPTSVPAIQPNPPTGPTWAAIGPTPIPNGQTIPADANGISLTQAPVSGRLTAVAIDPADPNTVYVGAAQGGVYQSRDGGLTWTRLTDTAMTLAIGSLQLDPNDTTGNTLLVGSGEANFAIDSFAGLGVYKLTGLKSGNPVLSGPFGSTQFAKRSIPGLAIDPNNNTNHTANVYVGSATGIQGIGGIAFSGAPARGLFRSTDGASTFTKLTVAGLPTDFRVTSIVYEPGSSDDMFFGVADAAAQGIGGVYFTTNASAASPTFTKVLATNPADFAPVKLALNKLGDKVTVVAVTGETADKSGNQGKSYSATYGSNKKTQVLNELPAERGFAVGRGFYNLDVAIDPTNASNIYIVGTLGGTFLISRNGGGSLRLSDDTLHGDIHIEGVVWRNPTRIYTGHETRVVRPSHAG